MGTKQYDVDTKMVNFYNSMKVDLGDLEQEQTQKTSADAAIVGNFFGSGIVPENLEIVTILDTADLNQSQQTLMDGYAFDGQNVYIGSNLTNVSDTTEGNHLKVTINNFYLAGTQRVSKVCIIGDEFGGDLVYDEFWFRDNGSQVSQKRYTNIRAVLFNDAFGNANSSYDFAHRAADSYGSPTGSCVITEVSPMEVSPDPLMVAQNSQPDQFFASFKTISSSTLLSTMLQAAIGSDKSVSDLDFYTTSFDQRELPQNNLTKKIGQKFYLTGDNIQKISVLLAVKEDTTAAAGLEYAWSGSVTLSLHQLQTTLDCPVALVPDNLVDYDPSPAVVATMTLDSADLAERGIALDDYGQKVDFVFTSDLISDPVNTPLNKNNYYAITLNRTGDSSVGDLLIEEAQNLYSGGYLIEFDGSSWTNVTTSDMWFEIHSDAVKVNDGIAYQDGVGIQVPKLKQNSSGIEAPHIEGDISLYNVAFQSTNFAITEVTEEFSDQEEDPTTGDRVYSRKTNVPSISVVNSTDLTTLLSADSLPIVLSRVSDWNARGNPTTITGVITLPGQAVGNKMTIISPASTLLTNNIVGSIMTPNITKNLRYRITSASLVKDAYGDVVKDNQINSTDLAKVLSWLPDGYDISLNADQTKIVTNQVTLTEILRADVNGDGVVDSNDVVMLNNYINHTITSFTAGSYFQKLEITVEALTSPDPIGNAIDIPAGDSAFTTVPFVPIQWQISFIPTWYQDYLYVTDSRRLLPTTYTEPPTTSFGGRNDFYIPGNQVIDGYQLNTDGTWYPVDFELNHLSLNIPVSDSYGNPTFLDGYSIGINLFDALVAEYSNGKTVNGLTAMQYADRSYVQTADFSAGKVKIAPSIQSMASTFPVPFGTHIDDVIGLNYDSSTSNMTLYINHPYTDGYDIVPSLRTKILTEVFLKKAGFANDTGEVTMAQMQQILGI